MYYKLAQLTLGVALKIIFRPWAEGARNVPQRGAAIIASNHLSFADHFFGPLPLRRQVIYLAKSEYFTGRGLKGFLSRAFFSALGQVPIDRGGGAASERAMRTALRVLAEGKLLGQRCPTVSSSEIPSSARTSMSATTTSGRRRSSSAIACTHPCAAVTLK